MPHFRLEYSTNIFEKPNSKEIFLALHQLLENLGPFDLKSIKSRIIPCEHFFVSDGERDQSFVHLELAILPGRSAELRKNASSKLLETIKEFFPETVASKNCCFSVEIREFDGDCYSKTSTGDV